MERFHVNRRLCGLKFCLAAENPGGPFKKLRSPDRDLIGMNVKLPGQHLLDPDGGPRYFAMKTGLWFRRGRLLMLAPVLAFCRVQADSPLIQAVQNSRSTPL